MGENNGLTRKEFLASFGKGLLGAAVCGVAAGAPAEADAAQAPNLPFALVQAGMLMPGLEPPLGVAFDLQDRLFVAGVQGVKVFDAQLRPQTLIKTSGPAVAVAVDPEGNIYAAQRTRIEKFDARGALVKAWGEKGDEPGQLRYVTGIAANDRFIYVTDSGARKIHRYAADGDYIDEMTGPAGDEKRYIIPSAYFDCKLDAQGNLFVGHTGMHRVERYDADGKLLAHWGQFSSTQEGFCGCCNPTNIAIFKDGRVATTEKGVPRLKVYDAAGKLLACLNEKEFPGNTAGMALAIDSKGRIALAEPVTKQVRFYELKPRQA